MQRSKHKIHLRTHLLGDIVLLEAFELCDGAGRLRIPDRRRSAGRLIFPVWVSRGKDAPRPGSDARKTQQARPGNRRGGRPRAYGLERCAEVHLPVCGSLRSGYMSALLREKVWHLVFESAHSR
jgi:hypothetical protein